MRGGSTEQPVQTVEQVHRDEWVQDPFGWVYYNGDGVMVRGGSQEINGKKYLFDENGHMMTGVQTLNDKLYYFKEQGGHPASGLGAMDTSSGWKKISGNYYYAKKNGSLVTGWKKIKKNKFYFHPKGKAGVKGSMAVGFTKIGKNTYYFNPKGKTGVKGQMMTGWLLVEGQYYYLNDSGKMAKGTYVQGYEIKKNGKLSERANELKKMIVKLAKKYDRGSQAASLKACYDYVVRGFSYKRSYSFRKIPSWEMDYAYNMLKQRKGNCYSFAATFAFLAREVGYTNARAIAGMTGARTGGWTPHGWVEIKMGNTVYTFDPEMQHAGHGYLYKLTYRTSRLRYKK
ncbi:MAG: transglutaminase domain-containing protein [Eubacteriales bacterium]|nr:transglutaminase domain-containing protein [Eubacteriales bacterium]